MLAPEDVETDDTTAQPLRLGPREWKRRLWHMSPGLLPFLLWAYPHRDPISPTLQIIIVVLSLLIAGKIFVHFRRIARNGDGDALGCVLGYAAPVLGMLMLFPGQVELGLTVLAILAFGDGSATIGGLLFRGPALPWNPKKTWSGSLCFVLAAVPLASLVYWGETTFNAEALGPPVAFSTALICGGLAALVGAVAESLSSKIDDNLRVGITSAVTVVLAHGWLVGWAC